MEKTQFNVLLPERLAHQIRTVAEIDGERPAHAVEKALQQYIDQRKLDPRFQEAHEVWAKEQRRKLRAL